MNLQQHYDLIDQILKERPELVTATCLVQTNANSYDLGSLSTGMSTQGSWFSFNGDEACLDIPTEEILWQLP